MALRARLSAEPRSGKTVDRSADLILSCLPYLRRQSYKFGPNPSLREDLVAEGLCVLCRVVQHYDPNKGVPFQAYASSYVKSAMRTVSIESRFAMHLPDRQLRSVGMAHMGPSILPAEEFREDAVCLEDDGPTRDAEMQLLEHAKVQTYKAALEKIRASLSADENIVLDILMDDSPETAKAAAGAAGISAERVRQISFRLMPKMRNLFHTHGYSRDFFRDDA